MSIPSTGMSDEWLAPSAALSRMTQPEPLSDPNAVRAAVVRFGYQVGPLGFLVGAGVLSELLPSPQIYPIPNVDAAIRGYVNVQGALVPVWDIRALLGAGFDADHDSVLVLGRGDRRVGMLIRGLPRALKQLSRVVRPPRLPDAFGSFAKEAWLGDGNVWFEFDQQGFFTALTERIAA